MSWRMPAIRAARRLGPHRPPPSPRRTRPRRRRMAPDRRPAPPKVPKLVALNGRGRAGRPRLHELPQVSPGEDPQHQPERVNGEIKRRTEVVGIFPNEAAIVRLADPLRAERRAGGPARPLHDPVHHPAVARRSPRQPAALAPDQSGARCRRTRRPGHDHQRCVFGRAPNVPQIRR
jgi:hypothetical protein